MAQYNKYTVEQEDFLKVNAPLMSRKELTELFNLTFGIQKTDQAIKAWCNKRGYHSSSDGKFKDGNVSWQTGLRGEDYKSHFTEESWKTVAKAANEKNKTAKIGDEVMRQGVPYIVVSLEYGKPFWDRLEPKRRYVWKQIHGEIPKDHCIVHLDGNQMNCDPSNLYCMPNRFKPIIAKNHWWFGNAELTLTAIKWCELHYAIKDEIKKG